MRANEFFQTRLGKTNFVCFVREGFMNNASAVKVTRSNTVRINSKKFYFEL